jgi:heme a synthase
LDTSAATRRFHKLCLSTLVAVYFLILVGGVVRSTGSGMGCPDWPKCFGSWVPPTSVDQLPSDYKEKYAEHRSRKNQKFAGYLTALGFSDTAEKILRDKSILVEADFNPTKTWVEYVNRLVGVAIGLFIIAVAWRSLAFRSSRPAIFWLSLSCLAGVIFQGWFGSIVVSTNLTTWTITVHMFLALVIVALLIQLYHLSGDDSYEKIRADLGMRLLLGACILVLLVQIFLGTQVREVIDQLANSVPRDSWMDRVGVDFVIHRSFSWTVLVLHAILLAKWRKTGAPNALTLSLIILILSTFLTGVGMSYFDVPAFLQPVHLLVATLTFGIQYLLLLRLNRVESSVLVNGI